MFANKIKELAQILRYQRLLQIIRFLAVGGLNTAFGYGIYSLLVWFKLPLEIALLLGTAISILFNFVTYGRFAFGGRLDARNLPRFVAIYVVFYCINAGLLRLFVTAHVSPYLGQIALVPFIAVGTYFSLRYFVYRVAIRHS